MALVTQARLRELLHYSPETGAFTWLAKASPQSRIQPGDPAGSVCGKGYILITVDGKQYKASRLAWLYMTGEWPAAEVDHGNRVKTDDRWVNLSDVGHVGNMLNKSTHSNNSSGYPGVRYNEKDKRWVAYFMVNKVRRHVGSFLTAEEAWAARHQAREAAVAEWRESTC